MKTWLVWLIAGVVALLGGILGLLNPVAAQVTSTTIAGWALVLMGLLQGRAALKSTALRERAGSFVFAAAGLFLGLSLIFGPIGEGRLLGLILAGLLIVSGAAKLWIGRRAKSDPFFWLVVGAGCVSAVLGILVGLGSAPQLGVLLSLELLADGVALIVMALRLERPVART